MILFPHGFSEVAAFAQWTRHLGGIGRTIESQTRGVAESSFALSEMRRFSPEPFVIPSVLSRDEAPEYFQEITGETPGAVGWLCFMGIGESRVIARNLDLLSALHFISQAPLDREFAIERDGDDTYRLISGHETGVMGLEVIMLHTHKNRIALPSETDFHLYERMARESSASSSYIHSRPRRGHQLGIIERVSPWLFEIRFCRDRKDTTKGVLRSEMRRYEVSIEPEKTSALNPGVERLEVIERSSSGGERGRWTYDYELYPNCNIQNFWKNVLDRSPQKPLAG